MATRQKNEGAQLRYDFDVVCETLLDLADRDERNFDFDDGVIISEADSAKMKISYNESAQKAFWKPYLQDAKLDQALESHEELVEDIEDRSESRPPIKTIGDAYALSLHYTDFLWFCVVRAALANPVFDQTGESPKFERIYKSKVWDELAVDTRLIFGARGYPHATVLTIQPQTAKTRKLMYTEFWILYYWAARLVARTGYNCDKTLPIRLVSLCGRQARVVSAVFSSGFIRCIGTRLMDPKGEEVSWKVHIGDYYDFRDPADSVAFTKEMIADPIGNVTIGKDDPRAERRKPVAKS